MASPLSDILSRHGTPPYRSPGLFSTRFCPYGTEEAWASPLPRRRGMVSPLRYSKGMDGFSLYHTLEMQFVLPPTPLSRHDSSHDCAVKTWLSPLSDCTGMALPATAPYRHRFPLYRTVEAWLCPLPHCRGHDSSPDCTLKIRISPPPCQKIRLYGNL